MRTNVKDFYGQIIGSLEEDSRGNIVAKDFYGQILGTYDKEHDITKTFFGKIVSTGDTTNALIWKAFAARQAELEKTKNNKGK